MDADDPFGYISFARGESAALGSATVQPDGYASPAHYQARSPGAAASEDDTGTPKAPLLPFEGRPGRPCPGAPKKGRAPFSHFDLSGEAPVRRLSFGMMGSQSTEQDLDSESCSVDDDDCMEEQEPEDHQQQQQQQLPPHQHAQQQAWRQQPPPQLMQQHVQQPWQQQLMGSALPSPQQLFRQQLVQQLQPLRPPQPPCSQLWGSQPQQHPQQQSLWNPLSPTGARPPPLAPSGLPQGSTTPVRLFR